MKPSEILLAAAGQLAEPGWWSHGGGGRIVENGKLMNGCALQAVAYMSASWPSLMKPDARETLYLRRVIEETRLCEATIIGRLDDWRAIALWNDAPGRTLAEVLDAFHEAARRAKENGE